MHATVRAYSNPALSGKLQEHADDVKALIQGVPGFHAYYLIDTGDGVVSVTVCDDETGTSRSTELAAEWIRDNLPELGPSSPQVHAGNVVLTA
jgi:hypothetical protein